MSKQRTRTYKCPFCSFKTDRMNILERHVKTKHPEKIQKGTTVKQTLFNIRNKKTKGRCIICGKETAWNEQKGRYDKFCSVKCKEVAGKRAKDNMRKKYGKDHLMDDPEYQAKLQNNRRNAGKYKFSDGGIVYYLGTYELDFLEFLDKDMGFTSKDIANCQDYNIVLQYEYGGKNHFYMPDFYMPDFRLIIEIKEGTNTHHKIQSVDRKKEELKEFALFKNTQYNYIKIVEKRYDNFIGVINILKNESFTQKKHTNDRIVIIGGKDF